MKRIAFVIILLAGLVACKSSEKETVETTVEQKQAESKPKVLEFKVIDSKHISVADIWASLDSELRSFTEKDYEALKPLVLNQDIPTLQKMVYSKRLTYESLTKFYLYRIRKLDRENNLALNAVISVNPNVIKEAREKDSQLSKHTNPRALLYSVYGMPILLKDNINTDGMPTTAGAVALMDNHTKDAFVVQQLKRNGALILGKANLSEWAYFFCGDCPSGYSAVGGQTLNPYGRKTIGTGGSSSGSAVAVAADFCAAAIGSETSGSILSPSSQNSVVGLKPTIGVISRGGIVPISGTLDTAGPITKNVIDNAIVLSAMLGEDSMDMDSFQAKPEGYNYAQNIKADLNGKRFGAYKHLMSDSLYIKAIETLKAQGAEIIELEDPELGLPDFRRLLNLDMKRDLVTYFKNYGGSEVEVTSVEDVVIFNTKDSVNTMPYGQRLFRGIVADKGSQEEYLNIKSKLLANGKDYFETPMNTHQLDGFISVNNKHAGYAAVAKLPALTLPMGYTEDGTPRGLTFIAKPKQEQELLSWAAAFERAARARVMPEGL